MRNSRALLVIDMQNDYFPGGKMELAGANEAAENATALLRCCRNKQLPILHIVHESVREGASFFLPDTEGQKIHPLLEPRAGETVITKNFPNSFLKTPLLDILNQLGVSHLLIVGMMTHMCVDATARAAKDLGFACTLIHDATATRQLSFAEKQVGAAQVQTAFIAALGSVCDGVQSTSQCIQTLTGSAG